MEAVLLNFCRQRKPLAWVRKCGKNLRGLSRRKFELKQKDIHLKEEEAMVYSKFP